MEKDLCIGILCRSERASRGAKRSPAARRLKTKARKKRPEKNLPANVLQVTFPRRRIKM